MKQLNVTMYCPVCGNKLASYYSGDVQGDHHPRMCDRCGWVGTVTTLSITSHRVEPECVEKDHNKARKATTPMLADELAQHFCIPCDLCHKWFDTYDCPEVIEKCNGKKHWRMMMERILIDEED